MASSPRNYNHTQHLSSDITALAVQYFSQAASHLVHSLKHGRQWVQYMDTKKTHFVLLLCTNTMSCMLVRCSCQHILTSGSHVIGQAVKIVTFCMLKNWQPSKELATHTQHEVVTATCKFHTMNNAYTWVNVTLT